MAFVIVTAVVIATTVIATTAIAATVIATVVPFVAIIVVVHLWLKNLFSHTHPALLERCLKQNGFHFL